MRCTRGLYTWSNQAPEICSFNKQLNSWLKAFWLFKSVLNLITAAVSVAHAIPFAYLANYASHKPLHPSVEAFPPTGSSKPAPQLQVYEPAVLLQAALGPQALGEAHSLMSACRQIERLGHNKPPMMPVVSIQTLQEA
jgi:hypothetical protein